MSTIDLATLLKLVGPLDDSTDPNSASARLRSYLRENIHSVGDLRGYTETALAISGDQHNKALQDLINHVGQLLGFDVVYGRYRGVQSAIGFDGLWRSPSGWSLVVEIKTTDVYTVKTAIILGYINDLVSAGEIKHPDQVIGLYIYGRFDAHTNQLEKAIVAERRQEHLRVASVEALLNLLELKQEYEIEHSGILPLLLPSPVCIDDVVNLVFDITAQERRDAVHKAAAPEEALVQPTEPRSEASFYLLPAADSEDGMPVLVNLHHWLDKGMWGLGARTGYRKALKTGDKLCFYAVGKGVIAEAEVVSPAFELERKQSPKPHLEVPYAVRLRNIRWFEESPVPLTTEIRATLSAFQGRDMSKGWAWFVQGTSKVTEEDFRILTSQTQSIS